MLELTKSNEGYLEAIGLLSEKSGTAQVRDIAEMLKVKMPSVTSAVKQLADMGLVEYTQYAPVKLTPQGRRIAGKIIVSHGILFDFLREELALPEERANEVACQIAARFSGPGRNPPKFSTGNFPMKTHDRGNWYFALFHSAVSW